MRPLFCVEVGVNTGLTQLVLLAHTKEQLDNAIKHFDKSLNADLAEWAPIQWKIERDTHHLARFTTCDRLTVVTQLEEHALAQQAELPEALVVVYSGDPDRGAGHLTGVVVWEEERYSEEAFERFIGGPRRPAP